jgi:hypothetical protein
MIVTMTGAIAAAFAARPLSAHSILQQTPRSAAPQPMPSHNAPANQNAPLGLDGAEIPVRNGERQVTAAIWTEIKSDAQKIFDMATDFKWQVDRANLNATLPLLLLQEAHRIEKLAKQVQERMKR